MLNYAGDVLHLHGNMYTCVYVLEYFWQYRLFKPYNDKEPDSPTIMVL